MEATPPEWAKWQSCIMQVKACEETVPEREKRVVLAVVIWQGGPNGNSLYTTHFRRGYCSRAD